MKSLAKHIARRVVRLLPASWSFYLKKLYYARALKDQSATDELDFAVLKHLVKPGDYVVDVGANVGDYTKFLSDLIGDQGIVYSVEPVPTTYELLTSSIKRLHLKNVRAFNKAVSDVEGGVVMEIPDYIDGSGENFYQAHIVAGESNSGFRQIRVHATKLDTLVTSSLGQIKFVKCDVEGHELSTVRSATKLIAESQPAWLIEFSTDPDQPDSDSAKVTCIFLEAGYQMFWYDGASLRPHKPGDKSVNYFFLTEKHVAGLRGSIPFTTA